MKTLIIDKINEHSRSLLNQLKKYCPFLQLQGVYEMEDDDLDFLKNADLQLLFINPEVVTPELFKTVKRHAGEPAVICIAENFDFLADQAYWTSVGYLLHPIEASRLIHAVEAARQQVSEKEMIVQNVDTPETNQQSGLNLIGIPTIEGFEIINLESIVRCEGLQKCTRIVNTEKSSIVSSYHIGMYKKLFGQSKDFFVSHRSHLVNLRYVRKFKKAGEIVMNDGYHVPVAKNRRNDFLEIITRV